ncbi:hypothetical protein ACF1AO_34015 [Streptomyces longwoodensis]|uniref:hypothetical protein n=1 Tax=Streptomyces longwoodensis TaxID=68231 RepID=UPI0037035C1B
MKRPRPLKRARVGWPPALRELKALLYEVYSAAGTPSLNEITADIAADDGLDGAPSRDTISRVISDGERAGQQADVVAVAWVLARRAAWDAPHLAERVRALWVQDRMAQGAGRPISDLRGDVRLVLDGGLGVHPALDSDGARDRFGILPAYIRRDHDARLRTVVDAALARRSGIAVLVGGSSTGKTRALWEAVAALPDGWRLWHPLSPTAPDAALAALADIAPKTVVWLNEAQHYLGPDPLGEQVAAGLRELLTDPLRAPVLILGTLWPEHWNTLTTRTTPDRHPGARELLGGHKIDVPKAFTPADLTALDATGNADPRLTQAAQNAADAQVTQYLAGVPYLMDRYHAAEGATQALIHAAMDARRLGAGLHLPLDWLADAAPSYLTDTEYHALAPDWLPQALAYVTAPCNGIPGILTPLNTSRPRNQRTRQRPVPSPQGPHFLLADYLDQHGRHHRAEKIPPIDFWTAAAHHAHPADLTELGYAAWNRGLYRDAAQLLKNATTHGNPHAASDLVNHLHILHTADHRPAQWAVEHVALDSAYFVAMLLRELREAGADQQVGALAERAAAHTALDHPDAVALLLWEMQEAGAHQQAAVLAKRAATHIALDSAGAVARLLQQLREAEAEQQDAVLAERAAAHAALSDLEGVAMLLRELRMSGADQQVGVLAERAAAHAALDHPDAVALLLWEMQRVGTDQQVAAVAERAATHTALDHPDAVALLLQELRKAGVHQQAAVLAERAAAHAALDSAGTVAPLLKELREAGAHQQAAALLSRDPAAHATLDHPGAVTRLLQELREAGAHQQAAALAERAAAHATLKGPSTVARLLRELREAGTDQQATALLSRDPAAHAALDDLDGVAMLLQELREAGAHQQAAALAERAATHAALDHPGGVTRLLQELREAGAGQQADALAERAAAHASPDNPYAVARLLQELREAGAHQQAVALAERAATHAAVDKPEAVAGLLQELRRAGAHQQAVALAERAATHVPLDDPGAVTMLLQALRKAGTGQQAAALIERLPAVGHFDLFLAWGGGQQFRLGREPDGSAAPSWTWDDLE